MAKSNTWIDYDSQSVLSIEDDTELSDGIAVQIYQDQTGINFTISVFINHGEDLDRLVQQLIDIRDKKKAKLNGPIVTK